MYAKNRKGENDVIATVESVEKFQTLVNSNPLQDSINKELSQQPVMFWKIVVLGLCILWATNFSVVKTVLQQPGVKPQVFLSLRFSLAATILFPQTVPHINNKDLMTKGMSIGFCIFWAYVGQAFGLLTSTAQKSAFICSMNVVWVALLSGILAKKFNYQIWLSVIMAVIGAAFIELHGNAPPTYGDLWLLLQPIGFGTGYIVLENVMRHYPESPGAVSGFKLQAVALSSIVWAILSGHTIADLVPILESPIAILGILYTGIVTTAGGMFVQAIAFKKVQATDASLILSSEPLWAALFSSAMLGEHMSVSDFFGGMLIVCSALMNEFNVVNYLIEKHSKKKFDHIQEDVRAESSLSQA